MTKEGEDVTGEIGSSQDLTGKVSKTYKYVKRELRGDGSKAANDLTMSRRRGYVQCDE